MRRNVRRLNREIGHVNLAAGALSAVKSVPLPLAPINNSSGLISSAKKNSSPPTLNVSNDDYYQENFQGDSGDDIPNKAMKKRGSGRKAANLSGIIYCYVNLL